MHPIGGATRDVFETDLGANESVVTAAVSRDLYSGRAAG